MDGLRPYLMGWKAYFGLAQTPGIWRGLDEGLRHRLRAIQLKQWRHGTTIYRELQALGPSPKVARQVAANSRRWWRNSGMLLNSVLGAVGIFVFEAPEDFSTVAVGACDEPTAASDGAAA